MADDQTLADCDIQSGSVIHLTIRLLGGQPQVPLITVLELINAEFTAAFPDETLSEMTASGVGLQYQARAGSERIRLQEGGYRATYVLMTGSGSAAALLDCLKNLQAYVKKNRKKRAKTTAWASQIRCREIAQMAAAFEGNQDLMQKLRVVLHDFEGEEEEGGGRGAQEEEQEVQQEMQQEEEEEKEQEVQEVQEEEKEKEKEKEEEDEEEEEEEEKEEEREKKEEKEGGGAGTTEAAPPRGKRGRTSPQQKGSMLLAVAGAVRAGVSQLAVQFSQFVGVEKEELESKEEEPELEPKEEEPEAKEGDEEEEEEKEKEEEVKAVKAVEATNTHIRFDSDDDACDVQQVSRMQVL
jgi:hypothetical protein